MTKEEIAQWVIDNRYPKSENEKTSDFEMYHFLIAQIGIIESENERLKAERDLPTEKDIQDKSFDYYNSNEHYKVSDGFHFSNGYKQALQDLQPPKE